MPTCSTPLTATICNPPSSTTLPHTSIHGYIATNATALSAPSSAYLANVSAAGYTASSSEGPVARPRAASGGPRSPAAGASPSRRRNRGRRRRHRRPEHACIEEAPTYRGEPHLREFSHRLKMMV